MENEVVLLDYWPSPFAMRVRIALAEKGIEYERKEEDLQNKSPLLLQMNPVYKKIPVLIHNGKPICESLSAVEYIDAVWTQKSPFLLSDPYLRAQARFWADFIDKKLYDVASKMWMTKGEEQENAKKGFMECLKLLEQELGEKQYFGGDNFGFLDVAFVPFYNWFLGYEKFGDFKIVAECPKMTAWIKRCWQKQSVSKSIPDQDEVYKLIIEIKKKLGIE